MGSTEQGEEFNMNYKLRQVEEELNELMRIPTTDAVAQAVTKSLEQIKIETQFAEPISIGENTPPDQHSLGSYEASSAGSSRRTSENSIDYRFDESYSLSPTWMDEFHLGTNFDRPATPIRPITPSRLSPDVPLVIPSPPPIFNANSPAFEERSQPEGHQRRKKSRSKCEKSPLKGFECGFCRNNGLSPVVYKSHNIKDEQGRVICPNLRSLPPCRNCGASGDDSHTEGRCPFKEPVLMKLPDGFKYTHPSGDNN